MKAKTLIEQSVKACYDAYAEYARKVDHIPVTAPFPRVTWERGSLKSSHTGWKVDGRLYTGSAEQVIRYWNTQADRWLKRLNKKLEGLPETPVEGQDEG